MEADGEQNPPTTRRRTKATPRNTNPDPIQLESTRGVQRAKPAPQTDEYAIDEGLMDQPRKQNTNVMRYIAPTSVQPPARATQSIPTPVPPRRTQGAKLTTKLPPGRTVNLPPSSLSVEKKPRRVHWVLLVGIGMTVALVLWSVGSVALAWGTQVYDNFRYGTPRTYQVDQVVGHGGDSKAHPSHFIAMNWNQRPVVVEFKAGDPAKSVSYQAPIVIVNDKGSAPVTLEFRDVTGDNKVDMIIHVHLPNQDQISVFVNDGDQFRPSTDKDNIHIT